MKKVLTLTAAAAVAVLSVAPATWAADTEGKVQSVEPSGKSVTLEDGTLLVIPPSLQIERKDLQPGAQVKVSYEDVNGEKIITVIEIQPAEAK